MRQSLYVPKMKVTERDGGYKVDVVLLKKDESGHIVQALVGSHFSTSEVSVMKYLTHFVITAGYCMIGECDAQTQTDES